MIKKFFDILGKTRNTISMIRFFRIPMSSQVNSYYLKRFRKDRNVFIEEMIAAGPSGNKKKRLAISLYFIINTHSISCLKKQQDQHLTLQFIFNFSISLQL